MQGFVVHVSDGAGFGEQVRVARSITRVDGDGASGGLGDEFGEIFPEGDRTKALVKENEFGSIRESSGQAKDLKRVAGNGDVGVSRRVGHVGAVIVVSLVMPAFHAGVMPAL